MFWNIYSKRVLISLRDSETYFYTWLFPILLATLFYFAFANLDTAGQFKIMPIGIIYNEAYQNDVTFRKTLEAVSGGGEDSLFELHLLKNQEDADLLLEKGEIDGYIIVEDVPVLMIRESGLRQTFIKGFIDRYLQTKDGIERLISQNPTAVHTLPALLTPIDYTERISLSESPQSSTISYFYALLAMVSLYGGFQGLRTVFQIQANLSPLGARISILPTSRFKLIGYDLLGGVTMQFVCLLVVVVYIRFILGVSFGSQLWLVLLTCLIGSCLGVTFGAMISISSKLKVQAKIAILITAAMVCCFLAGLMVGDISYTVMQNAPIVAWLNPAARITDAFYCLYYYDTYERFFLNIGIISIMSVICLVITVLLTRRKQYESI